MKPLFKVQHYVIVGNKKYNYSLSPINKRVTFFECKAACIGQEFLNSDLAALIFDLPNLIIAEKEYQKKQSDVIRFRIKPEEKKAIEKKAVKAGFATISSFLRHLALGV
jgi:hypothetical protein